MTAHVAPPSQQPSRRGREADADGAQLEGRAGQETTASSAVTELGTPGAAQPSSELDADELQHLYQLAGRRPAVDLLAEAIEVVRTELMVADRLAQRVRVFCLGLEACRDLGASDVVRDEFVLLAAEAGLLDQIVAEQAPYSYAAAAETINHLIRFTFLETTRAPSAG